MLKHIKKWLLNKALFNALLYSLSVAVLSLINPAVVGVGGLSISDKLLHTIAYTVLMWSWLLVFVNDKRTITKYILLIILLLFGVVLEMMQGMCTTYRTADWKDIIANTIGLFLGLFSFKFVYRFVFM